MPSASEEARDTSDERRRCSENAADDVGGSLELENDRGDTPAVATGAASVDKLQQASEAPASVDEVKQECAATRETLDRLRVRLARLRVLDGHRGFDGEHGQPSMALAEIARDELSTISVIQQRRGVGQIGEAGDPKQSDGSHGCPDHSRGARKAAAGGICREGGQ